MAFGMARHSPSAMASKKKIGRIGSSRRRFQSDGTPNGVFTDTHSYVTTSADWTGEEAAYRLVALSRAMHAEQKAHVEHAVLNGKIRTRGFCHQGANRRELGAAHDLTAVF